MSGTAVRARAAPTRSDTDRRVSVRLPRERRVSDILAAAHAVFRARGYANAAVSEIAAGAQVVEGTIYKYFENKQALLVHVLQGWYEGVLADYARELPGIRGPRARMRYIIWRHLRAVKEDPQLARLMFLEVRAHDDYPRTALYRLNQRYTELLTQVLAEGMAAGELRADLPARVVRDLVYGGIEHLTWRYVSGHGRLDLERRTDDVLRVIWDGIAAPQAAQAAPGIGALDPSTWRRQLLRLERVADRLEGVRAPARRRSSGDSP